MKAASSNDIKQELKNKSAAQLTELCLRLARFKKENKELLTYLLFEAADNQGYLQSVVEQIDADFNKLPSGTYAATKTIRKLLRTTNKYIRYTGSKEAEASLLLHFCRQLLASKIPVRKSTALTKLLQAQLKKIKAAIEALHPDLQYDYLRQLEPLEQPETGKKFFVF